MGLNRIDPNIRLLMKRFGQQINYYQSRLCSCVNDNKGSYDPNCSCIQGFYYYKPLVSHVIRTHMRNNILNTPAGVAINIDSVFTIPKVYSGAEQLIWSRIAHGDIVSLANKKRRETDILTRGIRDTLFAFDVSTVFNIYSGTTKYTVGDDYTLTYNDISVTNEDDIFPGQTLTINWLTDKGPDLEASYTVEFECSEQFRIWDEGPTNRGTTGDDLPKKVKAVLRRFTDPEQNNIDTVDLKDEVWE